MMIKNTICSLLVFISFYSFSQTEISNDDSLKQKQIYTYAEEMPEFPGGETEMYKFIIKKLEYPSEAINNKIEGIVYLKFTILEDGTVSDIQVVSKKILGYGLEEAAIAVIKKMPKWRPGKQNGKPIPVYFNLPIRFRIS